RNQIMIPLVCLTSTLCLYQEKFVEPQGTIKKSLTNINGKPFRVSYLIQQIHPTITTIRIVKLRFENCIDGNKCCNKYFLLVGSLTNYSKFCNNSISNRMSTNATDIEVQLQVESGTVELWLEYKARNATECPNHEFQCIDRVDCFNSSQICDGKFACKDHSDEVGCPYCAPHLAPCDNWSSICFNPVSQRCNRELDCPKGEDEIGCSKRCNSTSIDCLLNGICINTTQLCDRNEDCRNGYDEKNCMKQFCESPMYFLCNNGICIQGILKGNGIDDCGDLSDENDLFQLFKTCMMAFVILLLTILFTGLVMRWCNTRRDIHRLLQNLPEFPLPPFQGPGDEEHQEYCQLGYSDSDFRVGGDIYDAFVRSRRRIDAENNKNGGGDARSSTCSEISNFNRIEDGEIEIIKAIVSLSLPHKMCIGLDTYLVDLIERNQSNLNPSA
ncbi:hypothetical protein HHI36_008903, partial [Cryptolaemus montrouzieri]